MLDELPFIRLTNRSFDLFDLPLLHVKIGFNRLIQQIRAVTIHGLGHRIQITDIAALEKIIDEIIAANPKQVEQYRAGKTTILGFFVGQVMRASKGQAKPELVNELLKKHLATSN